MIGEGGSGGALALAVGNEVWMMENATYSILSPEGFASILWKDGKRAKEAATVMKITAQDLKELSVEVDIENL
jgi:acetyl-CoA carboxylase alpha subunit